jgi:release factor glutamine methyltransferase
MTVHDRVVAARHRLYAVGIPSEEADVDARLLAQFALGWDTAQFFSASNAEEPAGFAREYAMLVARRAAREPMAYVVGTREFWNLDFAVSPAVLIPRPETEIIVEAALELVPGEGWSKRCLDLCTGSGCLATSLSHERKGLRVVATDISLEALRIARRNARRHNVQDRIALLCADLFEGLLGTFDIVFCNPPYVPEAERPALQPEVREYEPEVALFAGPEGLDFVKRLISGVAHHLVPAGMLIFEFGLGQAAAVRDLIAASSRLSLVELRRDLQGIERTAIVKRVQP